MWSSYIKTYIFRDCFDEEKVKGDVAAIQKLLCLDQSDKSCGVLITTDILSVSTIAHSFETYKREDDGTWELNFYNEGKEICGVSLCNYKEVHLQFEIEEEIETSAINIHYCTVKAFKEYLI
jgi:hypothetical protein